MTDVGLVAKKLVRIETCLADLKRIDPANIETDVVTERFVEHTLQIAIQSVIDIASHIVADDHLGDPATNRDLFSLLHGAGWLDATQVQLLQRIVGFRNVLVHEYDAVDLRLVRLVAEEHTGDLQGFVDAVRGRAMRG